MLHGSLMNMMGTKFNIIIVGKNRQESEIIWLDIISELNRLNNRLNRFDKSSEIYYINQQAQSSNIKVSDEMWTILNICKDYFNRTERLFDITLKDFTTVKFDENKQSIFFSKPTTTLDLGGFAKGYAMEKIHKILIDADVEQCFVDFGNSSVLAIGHHPYGDSWRISIPNPYTREQLLDEISLCDNALSVSGNTPHYAGHIINPTSGNYNNDNKMVCIIAKSPLDVEVLTTAWMIADDAQKEFMKSHFEIEKILEYSL